MPNYETMAWTNMISIGQINSSLFSALPKVPRAIQSEQVMTQNNIDESLPLTKDMNLVTHEWVPTGLWLFSAQEDRNDLDSRIANLERENSELRRDNRELMVNYREITMDYRDLHHDHHQLLVDSQREAHRGYGGIHCHIYETIAIFLRNNSINFSIRIGRDIQRIPLFYDLTLHTG